MKKILIIAIIGILASCSSQKKEEAKFYIYDEPTKKYHKMSECTYIVNHYGASYTSIKEKSEVVLSKENMCPFCFSVEDVNAIIGCSESKVKHDKAKVLYDQLTKDGYALGDYDSFSNNIKDDKKRQNLYNAVSKEYDMGDYDSFSNKLIRNAKTSTPEYKYYLTVNGESHSVNKDVFDNSDIQEWVDEFPDTTIRIRDD